MKETILETLKKIECDYDVRVLYACESGSRAWGFPSKDSDYDVRFIYIHKPEHYLSIDPVGVGTNRDVIELPISRLLDVSGWEFTKAAKLFRKSNPPLMEWLHSGIVYYQNYSAIDRMKELTCETFSPSRSLYHYLNMAENNFLEFLKVGKMKVKQYFNVLRPVMAGMWIERFNEIPPLEFKALLDAIMPEGELKEEIYTLLKCKFHGDEYLELQIAVINQFLEKEIERLGNYAKSIKADVEDPTEKLNLLFRNALKEVWG